MKGFPLSRIPLTLLVDRDLETLQRAGSAGTVEIISIGKGLSEFLITEGGSDRTQLAIQWLESTLREKAPGPVLCTDISLLFEPSLRLDPLVLLRRISRYTALIVHWPGEFRNGVLSYAVPEHNHYRHWKDLHGIEIKGVDDAL